VVPAAPDLADVAAYNAFEPLLVVLQMLGLPPFARPSVAAGVFAGARVALTVTAFEEDAFGTRADQQCLLDHLAGAGRDLTVVTGPEAVHDAHVAVPDDVAAALADALRL
jgi:homoserine acetyltransferase